MFCSSLEVMLAKLSLLKQNYIILVLQDSVNALGSFLLNILKHAYQLQRSPATL